MLNAQQFSHKLIRGILTFDSIVVDATAGNGHDTLFLAQLVPNGHVYAFDIQEQAISHTKEKIQHHQLQNVTIIHDSHQQLHQYIPTNTPLAAAIFNLGYLPGSDKQCITTGEHTISAICQIQERLITKGRIVIVAYYGHQGGLEELHQLQQYLQTLPQQEWHVLSYQFINQKNNPPICFCIEKR